MYLDEVNAKTGAVGGLFWVTLSLDATDFYYNAVRSYVQLGSWDDQLLKLYGEAVEAAFQKKLLTIFKKRMYVLAFNSKTQLHDSGMIDSSCRLGGMFALSSLAYAQQKKQNLNLNITQRNPRAEKHLELAVNITETCHHVANSTKTKLLPEKFFHNVVTAKRSFLT